MESSRSERGRTQSPGQHTVCLTSSEDLNKKGQKQRMTATWPLRVAVLQLPDRSHVDQIHSISKQRKFLLITRFGPNTIQKQIGLCRKDTSILLRRCRKRAAASKLGCSCSTKWPIYTMQKEPIYSYFFCTLAATKETLTCNCCSSCCP